MPTSEAYRDIMGLYAPNLGMFEPTLGAFPGTPQFPTSPAAQWDVTTVPDPGRSLRRRPLGVIGTVFDWLDRPRASLSEAVQAAGADEDVLAAAWRGLSGDAKYGTLGETLFARAREPGLQAADVGAFVVDVASDPLIWLGPGIARGLAKVGLRAARAAVPPIKQVLPAFERGALPWTKNVKALRGELRELGLSKREAAKRVSATFPGILSEDDVVRALRRVPEREAVARALPSGAATAKLRWAQPGLVGRSGFLDPNDYVDFIRGSLRVLDTNFRPDIQTSIHSLVSYFGRNLAPPIRSLAMVAGPAGKRMATATERAVLRTAYRYPQWEKRFAEMTRGVFEVDRVAAGRIREGYYLVKGDKVLPTNAAIGMALWPKGADPRRAAELAPKLGTYMDDFWRDLTDKQHLDPFGRMLETQVEPGVRVPLAQAYEPNYFPHLYGPGMFTSKGIKTFRQKLIDGGMDQLAVDKYIKRNMSTSPRHIGHIDYGRWAKDPALNYEADPLKVIPKYTYDSVYRQELAKEFGIRNEILGNLSGDIKRVRHPVTGRTVVDADWVDRLTDMIVGRNPYERGMEGLFRGLNSFQAISKLGYATTAANLMQAPLNQWLRSGLANMARSTIAMWRPTKPEHLALGPAAFSRGIQEDVLKAALGQRSYFSDLYMKATGFPLSEKIGRHAGAIGGFMELDEMAKTWTKLRAAGDTRETGRLLSEINRRYGVIVPSGDLTDAMVASGGRLSQELLELGALEASRVTMHAFDVTQLPIFWRDPFWRTIMQFKSFIYKQSEFMGAEVLAPGLRWLASDGKVGDIRPLLRTVVAVPAMATVVSNLRDWTKSVPTRLWHTGRKVTGGENPLTAWAESGRYWDYRDPFWEDPDPASKLWTDAVYIGTLGLVGDMYEAAGRGRLADWLLGPTVGDITEWGEALAGRQPPGQLLTQALPGVLGIPSTVNVFE